MKIGDKVRIIAGDNKGTEAKIVRVDRKDSKAMLEGVGMVERHMKKTYLNPQGGKKTIHVGIDMSNLKVIETATGKAKKASVSKSKKGAK